jgi:hypothetical protein
MIKIRTRSERIPKIGDKFCLKIDPSNPFEILTNRGWLKLEEINLNDKIATLVDGNKLVYDYPIGIYKFKYRGQMYRVSSQQVDLDVTMDHKMYIKYDENNEFELTDAKNIISKNVAYKSYDEISENIYDIKLLDKQEEIYEYDGMVGCLEVPSHIFMIRQNNKNVWTGNCSRHGLTLSTHNRRLWNREIPNEILN